MKRLLSVFAMTALLLSFVSQARSQEISVDFFYNNLNGGSWIEVGNYGYCWQPDVAASDSSWRPYADGYWAYTDDGWTWISYEDWGWATYHYGRWVKLGDYGWVWKPGYEWGPAWVSWRTGGNYIGWAPLPPETENVYESRPLTGHLDVEFDIGPAYYNFCDVRYIGEPVLRTRLVPYQQNVIYVTQTVNVTNITYKNKTVYNYGPDINVVNQYSSRPIQKLKLERQTNVDVSAAAKSGGLTKVQGNALVVAAPTRLSKPAKEIAPPTVKTRVAQPKVEKGWSEVGDANAQTQLKEKIKTQDLKNVPPPTIGAGTAKDSARANASVSPGQSPAPGTSVSPFEKGKGKAKNKIKAAEEMQTTSPGAATSPGTTPVVPEGGKKKKNKRAEQGQPNAMTSPGTGAGTEMSPGTTETGKPGKGGKGKRSEQFGGTPPTTGPTAGPRGMTAPEGKRERKGLEQQNVQPPAGNASSPESSNEPRGGKHKKLEQQQPGTSPSGQSGSTMSSEPQGGSAASEARGKHQAESVTAPAGAEPTGAGQQGGERKHQGKKESGESPAPTPR
ncbi:MAG TPA: DUF6600 domain-containing protein [Chthoniobacterales bacterium]|jgi:hypothetical protein|nr:DUF6600 domain-containing protein [Chthoniobacterales bacterium]